MPEKARIITYETLEGWTRQALAQDDLPSLRARLVQEHPADIAAVIDRLGRTQRIRVFGLLAADQAAKVLDELSQEATRQLLQDMPKGEIGQLLDRMPMDESAELLAVDVRHRRQELQRLMKPREAAEVRRLLQYPPESAGRMMTEKFIRLRPEMTAGQALARIRKAGRSVETVTDLYVVDRRGRLAGVVSLREVVTADPRRRLRELMTTRVVSVSPETDREEVARLVSHYDFLAMPVVAADGKPIGIIPADEVIDVLVSETTEDILRFGGLEGRAIDQPYFSVSLFHSVRKRVGWLLLLFLAETLTGSVLRLFESELQRVVALSFFIPLLIGTGGNTGAQTVSTLIRGLALREVRWADVWRVLRKEILSGLAMGAVLGAVAFGRTLLWGNGPLIAGVVALAILAICTWANTIGSLVPLVAHRLRIDPATVSAPLITTLVDATGLAIYLLIAKLLLGI